MKRDIKMQQHPDNTSAPRAAQADHAGQTVKGHRA
jgi:hypothetical protein